MVINVKIRVDFFKIQLIWFSWLNLVKKMFVNKGFVMNLN